MKKLYAELKAIDPDLARQFFYLDLKGEEATRAADVAGVNEVVVWEEYGELRERVQAKVRVAPRPW